MQGFGAYGLLVVRVDVGLWCRWVLYTLLSLICRWRAVEDPGVDIIRTACGEAKAWDHQSSDKRHGHEQLDGNPDESIAGRIKEASRQHEVQEDHEHAWN